jgi:hypothetical protein
LEILTAGCNVIKSSIGLLLQLRWYEYLLLDMLVLGLVILVIILLISYHLLRFLANLCRRKTKLD